MDGGGGGSCRQRRQWLNSETQTFQKFNMVTCVGLRMNLADFLSIFVTRFIKVGIVRTG